MMSTPPLVLSLTAQPWWVLWLGIEAIFYVIFRLYIIPRANRHIPPVPYRDYGESYDRYRIMLRILERTEKFAKYWNKPPRGQMALHFREWFHDLDHVKAPSSRIGALTAAFSSVNQREQSDEEKRLIAYAKTMSYHETKNAHVADSKDTPQKPLIISSKIDIPDTSLAHSSSDEESSAGGSSACDSREASFEKKSEQTAPSDQPSHDIRANEDKEGEGMEYVIDLPDDKWTIKGLKKSNTLEFLAWIMFGHSLSDIVDDESKKWMLEELDMSLALGEERLNIVFLDEKEEADEKLRAFLVSLEDVNILHKPLFLYLFFYMVKFIGDMFLRCIGFHRIVTKSGVVAWHRPGTNDKEVQPMLFFHGISPGGFPMYLPLLLKGFSNGDKQRGLVIFDNSSISWRLSFAAINEQDTLRGIQQILDECFVDKNQKFVLAGHSYGTAPLTWVIKDEVLKKRISQVFLMDPITILLSEPSVVRNFFYAEAESEILTMAATEVFTQYYCRRHMAWYNTELWLEDIPEEVPITIVLAGKDEIINADRIRSHILQFHGEHHDRPGALKLIYWERARHCSCLTMPKKWRQMNEALLEHEALITQTSTRPKQE